MPRTAATLITTLNSSRLDWVEPLASAIQGKVKTILGSGPAGKTAKSILNGTPLRHRLHPALVDVPTGAWTTSFYLDLLSVAVKPGKRRYFQAGSDAAMALGIAGALPAALSGTADWADLHGESRRYGMVHALLNSVALASYGVSLAARRGKQRNQTLAFTSAGVGFAALTLSASIGGELVYNLGVNVPWRPAPRPPRDFVDVLASAELQPGEHRKVTVDDFPILLLRNDDGELRALQHWCPHAGAPLSKAHIENETVTCHWHGSQFCTVDGRPLQGPAATPLPVYSVREQDGRILVGSQA